MGPTSRASDDHPVAACTAHQGPDRADDPAVAALREQGAHRLDPARFRYIEVLSRKAGEQSGALRQQLDRQLAEVIAAYQAQFAQARAESNQGLAALMQSHPQAADDLRRLHGEGDFRAIRRLAARLETGIGSGPGPLGVLVLHIDGQAMTQMPDTGTRDATVPTQAAPLVELKTLRHFKDTWTALRVDRQMARSQEQAPENPGPLNSHLLVLRTLRRMQEIAPAYLEHFMAHAEALMWLDQAKPRGMAAPGKPVRPERDKRQQRGTKPAPSARSRST